MIARIGYSQFLADCESRCRMIAGNHHDLNSGPVANLDRMLGFRAKRVNQTDQAQERQSLNVGFIIGVAAFGGHFANSQSQYAISLFRQPQRFLIDFLWVKRSTDTISVPIAGAHRRDCFGSAFHRDPNFA